MWTLENSSRSRIVILRGGRAGAEVDEGRRVSISARDEPVLNTTPNPMNVNNYYLPIKSKILKKEFYTPLRSF
jgi:hypothetical protein